MTSSEGRLAQAPRSRRASGGPLLALVLVTGVAGTWLVWPRTRDVSAVPYQQSPHATSRSDIATTDSSSAPATATGGPAGPIQRSVPPDSARATWIAQGVVIDELSGAMVPGVRIRFEKVPAPAAGGPATPSNLECVTDADGRFAVAVAAGIAPNAVVFAQATDGRGDPVYTGNVQLAEDMTILIAPERLLHGRVIGVAEVCAQGASFVLVQESGLGRSHNLGQGQLDREGRFHVRSRSVQEAIPVRIRVGCGSSVHALQTDVPTLVSPEGFVGRLDLAVMGIRVVDEHDQGLPGATVAVALPETAANGTTIRAVAGPEGRVVVRVPRQSRLLVAAAMPGRRFAVAEVSPEAVSVDLVLRLVGLGEREAIRGHVRDAAGQPVAGAVVTALPDLRASLLRTVLPVQDRSGADGSFRLAVGGSGMRFELTAFTKRHGMSAPVWVEAPAEGLEFVMPEARPLCIQVWATRAGAVSRGGDLQWGLQRAGGPGELLGSGPAPIVTEPVAKGVCKLAVYWPEAALYGEAEFVVEAGEDHQLVEVMMDEPVFLEGQVVSDTPRDLRVRYRHPTWSESLVWHWATVPCSRDGRFQVMVGRQPAGEIEVLDPAGKVVASAMVRQGEAAQLVVRSR